jgi:hypothetical protein
MMRIQRPPVPATSTSTAIPGDVPAIKRLTSPAQPIEPEKHLRPEIIEALGFGAVSPWKRRLDLIRALPSDLTPHETDALLAAMMEKCPTDLYPAMHSTYIHEIACILQLRQEIREPFTQILATLARDTQRDQSTRDYAIQHLRQAWRRSSGDSTLQRAIVDTFRELTHLDPAVSTPALLSLHLLGSPSENAAASRESAESGMPAAASIGNSPPSFHLPDSDLVPLLEPIFADTTTTGNMPARLTAVRIAGERRMTAFRTPLLAALKDPSEHAMVRMAAANALGKIGDPADLESLATFDPGNVRVATALRHALQTRPTR